MRFEVSRVRALIEEARKRGYLEDFDAEEPEATNAADVEALDSLLGEFFPCNYDLSDDLVLTNPYFEWYDGAGFASDDFVEIVAIAAGPGSSLVFLDFEDDTRDIYEVVFDGEGKHRRIAHVSDGVPVHRAE